MIVDALEIDSDDADEEHKSIVEIGDEPAVDADDEHKSIVKLSQSVYSGRFLILQLPADFTKTIRIVITFTIRAN